MDPEPGSIPVTPAHVGLVAGVEAPAVEIGRAGTVAAVGLHLYRHLGVVGRSRRRDGEGGGNGGRIGDGGGQRQRRRGRHRGRGRRRGSHREGGGGGERGWERSRGGWGGALPRAAG